jgi:hypothetical protein
MKNIRIFGSIAGLSIWALFLSSGCSQTADLALKFTPDQTTNYRVIMESQRSVEWEGSPSGNLPELKGGKAVNRIEMTFSRQIQSVDANDHAVAKITIKGLKYLAEIRDKTALDFDSSKETDRQNPLNKLIGQSYTIEITPSGQVSKIIDTSEAQAAVTGETPNDQRALQLLSEEAIRERHTIPALPPAGKSNLHTGDKWTVTKSFSFDMMGSKTYDKIYTFKKIETPFFPALTHQGRRIAVVQMNAIPSTEQAKQLYKEQQDITSPKAFDNIDSYKGQLKLDLTDGIIDDYHEKLLTEWRRTIPLPENEGQPALLKMAAMQFYSIQRID